MSSASGFGDGNLAFDYGARTYRFGFGLDEAEAKLLLDALRPHLAGAAPSNV